MLPRLFHRPRSGARRHPRRAGPRLEALEDRRLPATFSPVTSAADGGPNSLRFAVIAADENLQDNTILLQSGTYQLISANTGGQENGAAQGDLDLTPAGHTVTIAGQGAGATIIDGGGLDRVLQVAPNVTVVLRGLTIQGGVARDFGVAGALPDTQGAGGGGIFNGGTLELDGVVIQNCSAEGGFGKDGTPGNLTAAGSGGYSALGGGIYNVGTLTINQSLIRGDTARGGKGGGGSSSGEPDGAGGDGGTGFGGGIYNGGTLTIKQSAVAANNAYGGFGGDGGIDTFGLGPVGGSGGEADGGGLFVSKYSSQTLIINCTISGNTAGGGFGGQGGVGGNSGNIVTDPGSDGGKGGSGGWARGGGIAALNSFSLYNSTVADNQGLGSLGGQGGPGGGGIPQGSGGPQGLQGHSDGGGIWAPVDPGSPALVTSVSSLIASNTTETSTFPDADAAFGATNTLIQVGDGATGITNGVGGDLVGVDPKLGPLRDNGGPTPTMALLPGSPAIDAGSNPLGLAADQRGYAPRAAGVAPDIGAYESGANAPPGGGTGGGGGPGGTGSGGATVTIRAAVVKVKGHRAIRVTDPATGAVKFILIPFGKGYRGRFEVATAVIDGVEDLVVRRPRGRKKFLTAVFSGIDGSPLPSSLA